MTFVQRLKTLIRITQATSIIRRYFVTNGFDATLMILGLLTGFWMSEQVDTQIILNACIASVVALSVSGVSSTYVSESAERQKVFIELENAMIEDLTGSLHQQATYSVPVIIAIASGLAPIMSAIPVLLVLHLASRDLLHLPAIPTAFAVTFSLLFFMGIYLGYISRSSLLWSGLRTMFIAFLTAGIVFFVL